MPGWSLAAGGLALAGWLATRGRPPPFDVQANLDGGRLVALPEGHLYHRVRGHGPDLVLLPGFAGNCRTWEFITPGLSTAYRVHWLDLLGHGLSDKPSAADYGPLAQAERVSAWMDLVGIERAALVASSAGAQPAVALAAAAPQRIAGLVLVDPFLVAGAPVRLGLWLAAHLRWPAGVLLRALYAQRWFVWLGNALGRHDPLSVDRATVDRQYGPYGTPGFFAALPALLAGLDPAPLGSLIARVSCPVLVVWGAADRTAGVDQALKLARRFPAGRAAVISGAGHVPQEETPEALLETMRPFLKELRW